jgi:SAM-dependent methyltransferase
VTDNESPVLSDEGRVAFYKAAAAKGRDQDNYNYRGLRAHAAEGLHDMVGDIAIAEFPKGATVLDVASGSGAMCLRLHEAGYQMTGCDMVEENFQLKGKVPFQQLDLNTQFSKTIGKLYDAVTATEIIEHLENPRQFLRQCFACLKPGGKLLLSTPNLETALNKAIYVTSGTARWYTDRDYMEYGHITPMPLWVLRKSLLEAGFRIDLVTAQGEYTGPWNGWWKMRVLTWLFKKLDRANSPQGDIMIIVAHKPTTA